MTARSDETLVVRADAGPRIGLGHLMRCLALAEAWTARRGPAVFVTGAGSEPVRQRIEREGFRLVDVRAGLSASEDARLTSKVLEEHSSAWAVVDGYGFDSPYHHALRASGHPLLVVDDLADLPLYEADALLNQNAHADLVRYRTLPETRSLLGLSYVLLRREFRERRRGARATPDVARRLLVTFGGADPANATGSVIDALRGLPDVDLEVTVVLGPSNSHRADLEQLVQRRAPRIELVTAAEDMGALMEAADLAVVGGGSSVWELAFIGVPALVLPTGRQEELLARGLSHVGLGRVLGPVDSMDAARLKDEVYRALHDVAWRETQSRKGRQLVDGEGADRVVSALAESGGTRHA